MANAWLLALLIADQTAASALPTVVVAPLKTIKVETHVSTILTNELRTALSRSGKYRLVAPEEMQAIDTELQRQLQGGCDETSCIAELAGALGAQLLVTGSVGRLEKLYTLNIKLVDIATVRTTLSASRHASKLDELLVKLPDLVAELDRATAPAPTQQSGSKARTKASTTGVPTAAAPNDRERLRVFALASMFDGRGVDGVGLSAGWRLNKRFGVQLTYVNSPGKLHSCIDEKGETVSSNSAPWGNTSFHEVEAYDACTNASGFRGDARLRIHLSENAPGLVLFTAATYRSITFDGYISDGAANDENRYRLTRGMQTSNINLAPGIAWDLRLAGGAHLHFTYGMRIPLNLNPPKEWNGKTDWSDWGGYNLFLVETGLGWIF